MRSRLLLAATFVLTTRCAGGSCTGLAPLPTNGIPSSQILGGGAQFRFSRHGLQVIADEAIGPALDAVMSNGLCIPPMGISGNPGFSMCNETCADGTTTGCQLTLIGHSDDGKDGRFVSTPTPPNPKVRVAQKLDYTVTTTVNYSLVLSGSCSVTLTSAHLADPSQDPDEVDIDFTAGVSPSNGELQLTDVLSAPRVTMAGDICPALSSVESTLASLATSAIKNAISDLLQPSVSAIIAGAVPSPPGVAGQLDFSAAKASMTVPADSSLETLTVLGAYASAPNGGLSFGGLIGVNADRDPSTRAGGLISEPAACAPGIPLIDFAAAGLPPTAYGGFDVQQATAFMSDAGREDFSLGVAEEALALYGSHIARGGPACFSASASFLTEGAFLTLGNDGSGWSNNQAPVTVTLAPTSAIAVEVGDDPLVTLTMSGWSANIANANVSATATADVTLGFDLQVVRNGAALALEPVLRHVTVSGNSPYHVAIAAAAELLAGSLMPSLPLPGIATMTTSGAAASHVDSDGHSFVVVRGTLAPALPALTDTAASGNVVSVDASGQSVTLQLDGSGVEWSARIDGGPWRAWSGSSTMTLSDPIFALQGHHGIDVRARSPGAPETTSQTPLHLDALIDNVAPTLAPAVDPDDASIVRFNGSDYVSAKASLQYAVGNGDFTSGDSIDVDTASGLATHNALTIKARDEAGNIGTASFDTSGFPNNKKHHGCAAAGMSSFAALAALLILLRRAACVRRAFGAN